MSNVYTIRLQRYSDCKIRIWGKNSVPLHCFFVCEKLVWKEHFFLEFSQIVLNFECEMNMLRNGYSCSAIHIPQPATYICQCIANNVQYNVKEYNSTYVVINFFLFYIIVQSMQFFIKNATLNCSVGWM